MTIAVIDWNEWRQHGLLIPVCLLGMSLVALHPYSVGVMYGPLEAEFGWSRSEIAGGPLATAIGTLLLAPLGGKAVDRFGPRLIALIGLPCFAAAIALLATAGPSIWTWWALYGVLAVALVLIYPSVWTAAVVRRFSANRGLALAVTLSGTGVAAAVFPYAAAQLLVAFGWRGAYMGLGALAFIVVFPLVVFLFDRSAVPAANLAAAPGQGPLAGDKPPEELLSLKFFRLAAAALIYSVSSTMLGINAVPILIADGFELVRAAEIAGLMGVGTITGRLLGGFLLDRFDGRFVAIGSACGVLICVSILLGVDSSPTAASVALLALGLAAGAEYDACAYLCTRHFHPGNFAALFGTIGGLSGFGAGMSPLIASAVYDTVGSYQPMLYATIPIMLVACVLFFSLGRYPDGPPGENPGPTGTAQNAV